MGMAKESACAAVAALLVGVVLAGQVTAAAAWSGPGGGSSGGGGGYGSGGGRPTEMENTVRESVRDAISRYPSVGAALVRLLFHDCWVNGCDGSVLLDSAPGSGPSEVEKKAAGNIGLRGFDVIDEIKGKLGDKVSCADIVVFAARDAADILSGGKIKYDVYPGREDGVVSSAAAADKTLPASTFTYEQLRKNFDGKDFTQEELVVLSGAHSIGVAHYESFKDRLAPGGTPMNPKYRDLIRKKAYNPSSPAVLNNIRDMSYADRSAVGYDATRVNTASPASGVLDNSYYTANKQNMVLFRSDWELVNNKDALAKVEEYRDNAAEWNSDFAAAMKKLSDLKPPAGQYLEVRKKCNSVNSKSY